MDLVMESKKDIIDEINYCTETLISYANNIINQLDETKDEDLMYDIYDMLFFAECIQKYMKNLILDKPYKTKKVNEKEVSEIISNLLTFPPSTC